MRSRWEVPIPSPMKMMTFFARSSVDATPWAPPAPARAPHAMALTITDNTATTRLPRTMLDAPCTMLDAPSLASYTRNLASYTRKYGWYSDSAQGFYRELNSQPRRLEHAP